MSTCISWPVEWSGTTVVLESTYSQSGSSSSCCVVATDGDSDDTQQRQCSTTRAKYAKACCSQTEPQIPGAGHTPSTLPSATLALSALQVITSSLPFAFALMCSSGGDPKYIGQGSHPIHSPSTYAATGAKYHSRSSSSNWQQQQQSAEKC
jgi:hypothetical protein